MGARRLDTAPLRIATWNIHNAWGTDGRRDVDRIARVIGGMQATLVGLQEVGCDGVQGDGHARGGVVCDAAELARRNGYAWHAVPTCGQAEGRARGNALLTRLPVDEVRVHDLSVPGREPRAALEAMLRWHGQHLQVVVTHLGLRARERRCQVEQLLAAIARAGHAQAAATLLLGDINEWLLWGRPLRWLHKRFGGSPSVRSFPARAPILALDRIWARPRQALLSVETVHVPGLRCASDHLPVLAKLDLSAASHATAPASSAGALLASSG